MFVRRYPSYSRFSWCSSLCFKSSLIDRSVPPCLHSTQLHVTTLLAKRVRDLFQMIDPRLVPNLKIAFDWKQLNSLSSAAAHSRTKGIFLVMSWLHILLPANVHKMFWTGQSVMEPTYFSFAILSIRATGTISCCGENTSRLSLIHSTLQSCKQVDW